MSGKRVGYVRVSTVDQNTGRQLDGVELDKRFEDKASGKDAKRPELVRALEFVREDDTLVVHSMDRLARSLQDLLAIVGDLVDRGVTVQFVKENLTFTADREDPYARFQLQVLGAVAELERSIILERQREGIALAKSRGVYTGRKPALSPDQVVEVVARLGRGESATDLAKEFGVARATVYNAAKRTKGEG